MPQEREHEMYSWKWARRDVSLATTAPSVTVTPKPSELTDYLSGEAAQKGSPASASVMFSLTHALQSGSSIPCSLYRGKLHVEQCMVISFDPNCNVKIVL